MSNILFVIVLYQKTKEQSLAWLSLQKCLSPEQLQRDVYVHDNTKNNIFLAAAYNIALKRAMNGGYQWLALLDDDTEVNMAYIDQLAQHTQDESSDNVLVPVLQDGNGKTLSPAYHYGVLSAFNSATVIRTSVIESIGGFNEKYPLDYLDYWLFRELHRRHIKVSVLAVSLKHNLSCSDYSTMTQQRYLSILRAENQFAKEGGIANILCYKLQLCARIVKWTLIGHPYIRETWNALIGE